MSEKRYIYAVDDFGQKPRLESAEVAKVTAKRVTTVRSGSAFLWRTNHDPEQVRWTPKDAWEAFIKKQRGDLTLAENAMARAMSRIEMANEALRSLANAPEGGAIIAIDGYR